ncbi:MAG: DUF4369 domain-containing protein [Haliscomenobacter sp.]|nr:DUF4369 domain-containing protein [Haliscomenobacter sp.]
MALFLLYATALLAQTEKANFTLNAHITGLNSPYVVFSIKNDQNKWVSDTIPVSDNRFVFSINVDKTTYMRIDPKMPQVVKTVIRNGRNQGYIPSICSYIVFFGSPGQTIEFGGDILDFVMRTHRGIRKTTTWPPSTGKPSLWSIKAPMPT